MLQSSFLDFHGLPAAVGKSTQHAMQHGDILARGSMVAFDNLSHEGKEALLNFVRALARRQARLDYAEEQAVGDRHVSGSPDADMAPASNKLPGYR